MWFYELTQIQYPAHRKQKSRQVSSCCSWMESHDFPNIFDLFDFLKKLKLQVTQVFIWSSSQVCEVCTVSYLVAADHPNLGKGRSATSQFQTPQCDDVQNISRQSDSTALRAQPSIHQTNINPLNTWEDPNMFWFVLQCISCISVHVCNQDEIMRISVQTLKTLTTNHQLEKNQLRNLRRAVWEHL